MEYITVPQESVRRGITPLRVQERTIRERIPGVIRLGNSWLIQMNMPTPVLCRKNNRRRPKTEEYASKLGNGAFCHE